MLFCPSCGVEYRPGFQQCAVCDVALVDEQPVGVPEARSGLTIADSIANGVVIGVGVGVLMVVVLVGTLGFLRGWRDWITNAMLSALGLGVCTLG